MKINKPNKHKKSEVLYLKILFLYKLIFSLIVNK